MTDPTSIDLRQARKAQFRALTSERLIVARVRAGRKIARHDGRRLDLRPDRLGVLQAGVPYTVENHPPERGPYIASALIASRETLARLQVAELPFGDPFATTSDDRALAAFERSATVISDPFMPARLRENAVREVLLWLAEAGVGFQPRPVSFTDRLRSLVAAEPGLPWSAAMAGRSLAVSEATLRRRLAEAGTTFHDVLADVRMTCALGLLQTTTFPVNRIALEVGYASPSRFALRFRARFGLRPSEIRSAPDERIGTQIERAGTHAGMRGA